MLPETEMNSTKPLELLASTLYETITEIACKVYALSDVYDFCEAKSVYAAHCWS